jgi:peptidoglycan/xylan/chitin deacetylase (PgdA/CDA1 family)
MEMTGRPPSRRQVLAAPALFGLAGASSALAGEAMLEPVMRLVRRPGDPFAVALTLDACSGLFDRRIADALVDARIPATLFVTGLWLRRNAEALAFLLGHRDLFAIENHGDRHLPPVLGHRRIFGIETAGDLDDVRRDVVGGARDIADATGRAPRWYRAATGFYSPEALAEIRRLGFDIGGYSLTADMGASLPAAAVAHRIATAANGEVIVAHVNQPRRPSGAGVAAGVLRLAASGARFVRLGGLGPDDVIYG